MYLNDLWSQIRGWRPGVQMRRQVVIGSRTVDLLPPAVMLVGEAMGTGITRRRGGRRDEALRRAGYRVLRVPASLVERRLKEAVALVRDVLGR